MSFQSVRAGEFWVWMRRPQNQADIGQEVVDLVGAIMRLSETEIGKISDPVRQGFRYNFETESAGGEYKWPRLAFRTREERSFLGYAPEHMILQRTRQYMRSWIERGHPRHFERTAMAGRWVGRNVSGQGDITILVGSSDPRVFKLSGGLAALGPMPMEPMQPGLAEIFAELGVAPIQEAETAPPPPREVHKISQRFADRIGNVLDWLLSGKAREVKTRS